MSFGGAFFVEEIRANAVRMGETGAVSRMPLFRRISSISVAFFYFAAAVSAQNDRNFNGRWVLNPNVSQVANLPQAPDQVVVIDQQSSTINWSSVPANGKTAPDVWTFNTDGSQSRREAGGTITSSKTKWEGAALLTSTNVSSPTDSYAIMDRWQLSKSGNRLTIEREVIGPRGKTEGTLIYERERAGQDATAPAPVPPPSPTSASPTSASPTSANPTQQALLPSRDTPPPFENVPAADFVVKAGTRLPLRLINSVSTKHSVPGDRVYLETAYPVFAQGRVVIPTGSYVQASLTEVKRAGKVKGKSELFLRFDSITLPNGTTRDFRARLSQADGKLNAEGKLEGDTARGSDAKAVGVTTAAGAGVGSIVGAAAGHAGMGAGIGAAAGALGGLAGVLSTRGPDTVLQSGSTVEMQLDRDLTFTAQELAGVAAAH